MFSGQHAERQGSKVARSLLSIVIMVLVVFGLSRLLNTFVFGAYEIPSGSMEDTIEVGDLVFSEKLSYYTSEPQKGDIVTFADPLVSNRTLIKRVIATAGQTVDIDFNLGRVYVDGVMLEEDYINDLTYREEGTVFPLTVPEGEVFLMGDNRNHSNDSRDSSLGTVDTRLLIGKAVFLVFPGRDYLTEQREFGRIGLLQ
mgnify:CR=1 FL=1